MTFTKSSSEKREQESVVIYHLGNGIHLKGIYAHAMSIYLDILVSGKFAVDP